MRLGRTMRFGLDDALGLETMPFGLTPFGLMPLGELSVLRRVR